MRVRKQFGNPALAGRAESAAHGRIGEQCIERLGQRGGVARRNDQAGGTVQVGVTGAGAKLGAAATGPYLTAKGQTYDLVIDARFTEGRYEFVCEPHEAIGMKGTLVVKTDGVAAGNR